MNNEFVVAHLLRDVQWEYPKENCLEQGREGITNSTSFWHHSWGTKTTQAALDRSYPCTPRFLPKELCVN